MKKVLSFIFTSVIAIVLFASFGFNTKAATEGYYLGYIDADGIKNYYIKSEFSVSGIMFSTAKPTEATVTNLVISDTITFDLNALDITNDYTDPENPVTVTKDIVVSCGAISASESDLKNDFVLTNESKDGYGNLTTYYYNMYCGTEFYNNDSYDEAVGYIADGDLLFVLFDEADEVVSLDPVYYLGSIVSGELMDETYYLDNGNSSFTTTKPAKGNVLDLKYDGTKWTFTLIREGLNPAGESAYAHMYTANDETQQYDFILVSTDSLGESYTYTNYENKLTSTEYTVDTDGIARAEGYIADGDYTFVILNGNGQVVELKSDSNAPVLAKDVFKNAEAKSSISLEATFGDTITIDKINLRLGNKISADAYDETAEYGVIAFLPVNAFMTSFTAEFSKTEGTTDAEKLTSLKTAGNAVECTPTLLEDGSYQFAWVINNITEQYYSSDFMFCLYMLEADGTVTFSTNNTTNVRSTVADYTRKDVNDKYIIKETVDLSDAFLDALAAKVAEDKGSSSNSNLESETGK